MQYLLLIENNCSEATADEWDAFFELANKSGFFRGGSAIGACEMIGGKASNLATEHLGGYMRFDANDRDALLALLEKHPVALRGGTLHLCDLPRD